MICGQVMGYPHQLWMTWVLYAFAAWSLAVTVWIVRSHYRERKLRSDFETLGDLFAEVTRGLSARITAIKDGEENIDRQGVLLKPGRSKAGLTAKSSGQESKVRVRVEESTSAGNSQVRENSDS